MGGGVAKQADAGKIGYAFLSASSLDIIGAGTTTAARSIKLWADHDVTATGPVFLVGTTVTAITPGSASTQVQLYATGIARIDGGLQMGSNNLIIDPVDGWFLQLRQRRLAQPNPRRRLVHGRRRGDQEFRREARLHRWQCHDRTERDVGIARRWRHDRYRYLRGRYSR